MIDEISSENEEESENAQFNASFYERGQPVIEKLYIEKLESNPNKSVKKQCRSDKYLEDITNGDRYFVIG